MVVIFFQKLVAIYSMNKQLFSLVGRLASLSGCVAGGTHEKYLRGSCAEVLKVQTPD